MPLKPRREPPWRTAPTQVNARIPHLTRDRSYYEIELNEAALSRRRRRCPLPQPPGRAKAAHVDGFSNVVASPGIDAKGRRVVKSPKRRPPEGHPASRWR